MDQETRRFVTVWDPVVRFLHWWNAAMVTFQLTTGLIIGVGNLEEAAEHSLATVHAGAGLLFGAGLFARVVWLFIGPETAGYRDFLPFGRSGSRVFSETIRFYLRGLRGKAPLYLAHNSFAGPIYLLFFIIAGVQVASGSTLLTAPEKSPAAGAAHELHEVGFLLICLYIAAHLVAVFTHELVEKHSIVSAMIHGKKTFTESEREELCEEHPGLAKGELDEWKD